MNRDRLRICLQKSGRLTDESVALLEKCGLSFNWSKNRLISPCSNFPLDLMLVRDDDIPEYVADGTCEVGIVGENVLTEKALKSNKVAQVEKIRLMGFGKCRMGLALPVNTQYDGTLNWFNKKRIATSYPNILEDYLKKKQSRCDRHRNYWGCRTLSYPWHCRCNLRSDLNRSNSHLKWAKRGKRDLSEPSCFDQNWSESKT